MVTDEIRRDFELNTQFSVLGTSLERWRLMALVIICGNSIVPLRVKVSGGGTGLSEIQDDGTIGHPHTPSNKQGSGVSP